MATYLRTQTYYEKLYDHTTVHVARMDLKFFMKLYDKWFEIIPDEKPESHRSALYLNGLYMQTVGNRLLERYDNRKRRVQEMMATDKAKDEQIAAARLGDEPVCRHCGKIGLRIIDKDLHTRAASSKYEEVLFMLKCTHCQKMNAYWEDGTFWILPPTPCPKCNTNMDKSDSRKNMVITTTYDCPACGHTYKDMIDLRNQEEKPDPDFEKDKHIFCLQDPKSLEEHRDAKLRYDRLIEMGKEFKEREQNKEIYDAVSKLKKLKIAEITPLLSSATEKDGYIEFNLEKPEIGKYVTLSFSCLDSQHGRSDYDSRNALRKLINKVLVDTNWRLMSEGISYRLGYLTGRLRAYETEEDMLTLVKRKSREH